MRIRKCPHCSRVVSLYLNKYRCSWCHIWLKPEDCLETGAAPETETESSRGRRPGADRRANSDDDRLV